jgi:hypothetical protein
MTVQPVTSPRLRGEVGSCAQRGFRVRASFLIDLRVLYNREAAPHPDPLPASGARGFRGHGEIAAAPLGEALRQYPRETLLGFGVTLHNTVAC